MNRPQVFFICFALLCIFGKATTGLIIECEDQSDCNAGEDVVCVNGLCSCQGPGQILSSSRVCIALAKYIDGKCDSNESCEFIEGPTECASGKCRCASGSVYFRGKCIPRTKTAEGCETQLDCFNGYDVNARDCSTDKKCVCSEGYYPRDDFNCRRKKGIDELCAIDMDCEFANAECRDGTCIRRPTFTNASLIVPEEETETSGLQPEADEKCTDDSDCGEYFYCSTVFEQCLCKKGYFLDRKICKLELGMSCSDRQPCTLSNSECVKGFCSCKAGYVSRDLNKKCTKGDGVFAPEFSKCNQDEACTNILGDNALCQRFGTVKRCTCAEGYALTDKYLCSVQCKSDSDCREVANSVCINAECVCQSGFAEVDGKCLPQLDTTCEDDDECETATANSKCADQKCTCVQGFVNNGTFNCLKRMDLGEGCELDVQCEHKSDSFCSSEKTDTNEKVCACRSGYVNVAGYCIGKATKINDFCMYAETCQDLVYSSCVKSKCLCANGWVADVKGTACKRTSSSAAKANAPLLTIAAILLVNFYYTNNIKTCLHVFSL